MRGAYYNEFDAHAAEWLRNLIAAGEIAPGDVDERSIKDVRPDDLKGYDQCHFFAGIGGWSRALRLAGWDDDRPVWTGSCPCQPFSAAGKGKAADDERHLWPAWFPLIAECRPPTIFGEQVEAAIGWGWLDAVFADLEGESYACGAAVLPACGVGAPHIRQRIWFVADALRGGAGRAPGQGMGAEAAIDGQDGCLSRERLRPGIEGATRLMAYTDGGTAGAEGLHRGGEHGQRPEDGGADHPGYCEYFSVCHDPNRCDEQTCIYGKSGGPPGWRWDEDEWVGDATINGGGTLNGESRSSARPQEPTGGSGVSGEFGDTNQSGPQGRGERGNGSDQRPVGEAGVAGFWSDLIWLPCTDGKARPTQPGLQPLVDGLSFKLDSGSALEGKSRTKMLRGAGNAIVPEMAVIFIECAA